MIRRYLARRMMRWAVRYVHSHRRSIQPNTVAEWIVAQWGFRGLLAWIRAGAEPHLMERAMPKNGTIRREMRELGERFHAQG